MAGPRAEKVAVVDEVKEHLERADAAILTEYRGLKVGDLAQLRRALRAAGAEYKIYKNTLVRRATSETGHANMDALLEGPTGIVFVDADVAAVAKVLRDFSRTNVALVVKGSLVSGSLLDASSTSKLADLPSREVLLSQIAGALAAPMQQFASLLKALPQNLAYGISAVIDQKREAGDTSAEDADVAAADADAGESLEDAAAAAVAETESGDAESAAVSSAAESASDDDTAAAAVADDDTTAGDAAE